MAKVGVVVDKKNGKRGSSVRFMKLFKRQREFARIGAHFVVRYKPSIAISRRILYSLGRYR
jgi:hypothetical protein